MATDRLQVLASKASKIRELKDKPFFIYENLTDMFMLAAVLGSDWYIKDSKLEGKKEGLILDKYLTEYDRAMLYALVYNKLNTIEDLTDNSKVYEIADAMADKGFDLLLEKCNTTNTEMFITQSIRECNALYEEAESKGYFFDD